MLKVLGKVRHWVRPDAPPSVPAVPYEVACACGHVLRGFRQPRHQAVPCSRCGRKVFVLPLSPFPAVVAHPTDPAAPRAPAARRGLRHWRLPLAVAGLTLVVVIVTITVLLRLYLDSTTAAARVPEGVARHMGAARRALAQGKFLAAVQELEEAQTLQDRHPGRLPAVQRRALAQLARQATLLADLLPESLEEILRHAADLADPEDQEWQRVFADRYRGKAVVFDAELHRDGSGQLHLDYAVVVHGKRARLELANVRLLHLLPLQKAQRSLLGLRLAGVRAEAEGTWSVQFEPDSGTLLTDLGAAAACCAQPEDDLREVVQRQAEWLAFLP